MDPDPIDECEPLEASSLFESVYILDNDSDQIKKHIAQQMDVFNVPKGKHLDPFLIAFLKEL